MQIENPIPESLCTSSPWYAIYTRHQHEKTIVQALAGKDFEVFLPLYRAPHRWKDRTKDISIPLFPCYVFLRGGLYRRLDVLSTPGVHYVLSIGGQPAPIPEAEIDSIRRLVESTLAVEPCPFLRCGDKVRIKSGPLMGIEGILVRKKSSLRLVLSVSLLEKSISVEVDGLDVERVDIPRCAANFLQPLAGVGLLRKDLSGYPVGRDALSTAR